MCEYKTVPKGKTLAYKKPYLIKQWHPTKNGNLTPYMLTANSHRKAWWTCGKHEWEASPHDRVHKKCNCPYCAGHRVCKDNCLATLSPELVQEWHPTKNGKITPYNVINGSTKKAWWICSRCGREWYATISNRSRGNGCECYNKVILKDGTICDSMVEALFYLRLKKNKNKFVYHGLYGVKMGKRTYDFYIPDNNTYMEVTSFFAGYVNYKMYLKTIDLKRKYVENMLKANFKFIQYKPTKDEYGYVRENCKSLKIRK